MWVWLLCRCIAWLNKHSIHRSSYSFLVDQICLTQKDVLRLISKSFVHGTGVFLWGSQSYSSPSFICRTTTPSSYVLFWNNGLHRKWACCRQLTGVTIVFFENFSQLSQKSCALLHLNSATTTSTIGISILILQKNLEVHLMSALEGESALVEHMSIMEQFNGGYAI